MTREELIELMARAFGPDRIEITPGHEGCDICLDARKTLLEEAQAVLSAIESSGLAIVPVEATAGMADAIERAIYESPSTLEEPYAAYRAMLSANPLKP